MRRPFTSTWTATTASLPERTPRINTRNREKKKKARKIVDENGAQKNFAAQTQCNFAHRTRNVDIILSFVLSSFLSFFSIGCIFIFALLVSFALMLRMHSIASSSYFTCTGTHTHTHSRALIWRKQHAARLQRFGTRTIKQPTIQPRCHAASQSVSAQMNEKNTFTTISCCCSLHCASCECTAMCMCVAQSGGGGGSSTSTRLKKRRKKWKLRAQ